MFVHTSASSVHMYVIVHLAQQCHVALVDNIDVTSNWVTMRPVREKHG